MRIPKMIGAERASPMFCTRVNVMKRKLRALKVKKGFTLVELIVVIAIIGVLAAILIPTLSGIIENAKKRSVESTCHSIENMSKAYVSTLMWKKGEFCTAASTVDMDEGDGVDVSTNTLKAYIERQIPKITAGGSTRGAKITLENGKVKEILYTEGIFTAKWTESGGMTTKKSADASAAPGAVVVV